MLFRRANTPSTRPVLDLVIDHDLCLSCGACVAVCPPDALFLHGLRLTVSQETCTDCNRCVTMCPVHALSLTPRNGRIAS